MNTNTTSLSLFDSSGILGPILTLLYKWKTFTSLEEVDKLCLEIETNFLKLRIKNEIISLGRKEFIVYLYPFFPHSSLTTEELLSTSFLASMQISEEEKQKDLEFHTCIVNEFVPPLIKGVIPLVPEMK